MINDIEWYVGFCWDFLVYFCVAFSFLEEGAGARVVKKIA